MNGILYNSSIKVYSDGIFIFRHNALPVLSGNIYEYSGIDKLYLKNEDNEWEEVIDLIIPSSVAHLDKNYLPDAIKDEKIYNFNCNFKI